MDNRRDGKKQQEKAKELSWGEAAVVVGAAGLAIGGLAYGLSKLFGETSTTSRGGSTSFDRSGNSWASLCDSPDRNPADPRPTRVLPISWWPNPPLDTRAIVMAVDATPGRGGGLLICHQKEIVYHYSLDWTAYITFPSTNLQQPDKFETTNAFIALKLFTPRIKKIKEEFNMDDEVTIKVDNSKFNRCRGRPDRPNDDDLFWERVQKLMTHCNGKWKYSGIDDLEFLAADNLSRGKAIQHDLYPKYRRVCCNEKALDVLPRNVHEIPRKYHV